MSTIFCPNCNQTYEVEDNVLGEKVECAMCSTTFVAQLPDHSHNQEINTDDFSPVVEKDIAEQVSCPHCKKQNRTGTKYCAFCGKEIDNPTSCPFCNCVLVPGAVFCPACGKRIDADAIKKTTSNPDSPQGLAARFNTINKKTKIVVLSALILALLLSVFLLFLGTSDNKSNNYTIQLENITIDLPDGVNLKMVGVKAGSFIMSAPDGENEENEVPHQATLKHDFYIGQTEVTQAQWRAVMGRNPSDYYGEKLPVENISWNDAMSFCEKLNDMGKAPKGWKFTLPTETQWEYAATGGNKSKGYKYSGSDNIDEVAWYCDNSYDRTVRSMKTHPVGQKKANELGLYDMSGNVYEWCLDDWNEDSSKQKEEFSRGNDIGGESRVFRGWCFASNPEDCRPRRRLGDEPGFPKWLTGFRIALVPAGKSDTNIKTTSAVNADSVQKTYSLSDGVKLVMVKIEAGSFVMSARDGENESDEKVHKAMLTKDFYIGQTEVTQAQWRAVMGSNPSRFKGDDLPVEKVSWNDAMSFCEKLNDMGKAPKGWKFTLPTETQWEYAATGGNKSKGYKYSGSDNIDEVAWYRANSGMKTHPVGQKKPNELGLYDMSGNVLECCLDDWNKDSSEQKEEFSRGNDSGGSRYRVFRGGGWSYDAKRCRSSDRFDFYRDDQQDGIGFRVALVSDSI